MDVPYFAVRDVALKSSSEFRAVEKQLLDLLYTPAEGKKIRLKDGFSALGALLKHSLAPARRR